MAETKWWGLDCFDKVLPEGEIDTVYVIAVAKDKEDFGETIELLDDEKGKLLSNEVLDRPGNKILLVVIGECQFLRGVRLVAIGLMDELPDIPNVVKTMFCRYPHQKILVFENRKGKRVYAQINHVDVYNADIQYREK